MTAKPKPGLRDTKGRLIPVHVVRRALFRLYFVQARTEWGDESVVTEQWRQAEDATNRYRAAWGGYGIVVRAALALQGKLTEGEVQGLARALRAAYSIADSEPAHTLRAHLQGGVRRCECSAEDLILGVGEQCGACQARAILTEAGWS